jgi:hypothetical protein
MFKLLAAVVSFSTVNLVIAGPLEARLITVYPRIKARFYLGPQCPELAENIDSLLTDTIKPNDCITNRQGTGFGSSWAEQVTGLPSQIEQNEKLAEKCTWKVYKDVNCPTDKEYPSTPGLKQCVTSTDPLLGIFPVVKSFQWVCPKSLSAS